MTTNQAILSGPAKGFAGSAERASTAGSGSAVLGAWLLAIGLHVLVLWFMYLYVLPYSGSADADAPTHIELIGDPEGTGTGVGNYPKTGERSGAPDFGQVSANALDQVSIPSAMPSPNVPLQGIGAGEDASGGGKSGPSIVAGPGGEGVPVVGIGSGGGEGTGNGPGIGPGTGGFFKLPGTVGEGNSQRGARRIVFVVDRSGSMIDTFKAVQEELKRSVSSLRQQQKFHVIFFSAGPLVENPPQKLVAAIAANKQEFFEFLATVSAAGGTHPEQALKRAIDLEPELIFLLTDGMFDNSVLARLREWNKDSKIKISTIAYLNQEGRAQLEQIAREHGGEFRFVSEEQLP